MRFFIILASVAPTFELVGAQNNQPMPVSANRWQKLNRYQSIK